MLMTEDEARTRWCPMSRVVHEIGTGNRTGELRNPTPARCISQQCSLWSELEPGKGVQACNPVQAAWAIEFLAHQDKNREQRFDAVSRKLHITNDFDGSARLSRQDASAYLTAKHGVEIAESTLAKLACVGGGPEFMKFGRNVYYAPDDLDDWVGERLSGKKRNTVVEVKFDGTPEGAFMNCLDVVTRQGRHVTDARTSQRYAPKVFARMPQSMGFRMHDLANAMENLFGRGAIIIDAVMGADRHPMKAIVASA